MAQPMLRHTAIRAGENTTATVTTNFYLARNPRAGSPSRARIKTALRLIPLLLLLTGCQSYFQHVADCKSGDWNAIGHKDGVTGEPATYIDRREFCDSHADRPTPADAAERYNAGWTKGSWDMWYAMGDDEGQRGLPSKYESHAQSDEVRKKKTPLNSAAYDAGWLAGNAAYWNGIGRQDGTTGLPLSGKEVSRGHAADMRLRFDDAAYNDGWREGNRAFWTNAGYADAHNGTPDSEFRNRAAAARASGVAVQEDAYRAAWNAELINYWRDLGTKDATHGKEFGERSREAKQKGLKILEQEYRQAWEAQLTEYWRRAGAEDGYGRPFMLDTRIANASRDGVFVIKATRELYTTAWQQQNARYCVPEIAFQGGRVNGGFAVDVCRAELRNRLLHAYINGQAYATAEISYRMADAEADVLSDRLADVGNRLRGLEYDIRAGKDRPANDETARENRRRERDRRELSDQLHDLDESLSDARRRADRYSDQMQRLHREIN